MLAVVLAVMPSLDLCDVALRGPFRECLTIDGTCALEHGPYEVCARVVQLADELGVDPVKALALAFHEGRLRNLPSFKGRALVRGGRHPDMLPDWVERSTMQCKPRDFCPDGVVAGCDYMRVCMAGLKIQLDNPRTCVHVTRYMVLPLIGPVESGFKIVCRSLKPGTNKALTESFARYHMPFGPAPAYGDGVMRKYHRLRKAVERAQRELNRQVSN
jgi:hypothetical protein